MFTNMVAAIPLNLPPAEAKQAWIEQELAKLTDDERARYATDAFFRGIVRTTLEQEWRDPAGLATAREAREMYGNDFERELADLETGRHPLHRSR